MNTSILAATQKKSHQEICMTLTARQANVLHSLLMREKMTAQEVANWLYENNLAPSVERNCAAPRLTELHDLGLVEVVGKTQCATTHRKVGVWKITEEALPYLKEYLK